MNFEKIFGSIILFSVAIVLNIIAILVYKGNTKLIHEYHQRNVKDKKAYGRAMGKALSFFTLPIIIAGIISLFTDSGIIGAVLIVGFLIAFVPMHIIQKKYNGGWF